MTFKELQDEVIALRFNEGNRASVKRWLNLRYAAIWNMADWHFKHVKGAPLAVTSSDNTPTVPTDLARVEAIYAPDGTRLVGLDPDTWRDYYSDPTTSPENPSSSYAIVDRELWLGATPSASGTYTIAYERRLSYVSGATGLVAAGVMSADSDQPIWEAEYDYLLVLDACILGCQLLEFPYADLVPQRDEIIAGMKDDLTREMGRHEGVLLWGDP